LAYSLHRQGFPYISVLEGGFPALIEQLQLLRGTVEPVILDHDADRWVAFLQSSGRDNTPAGKVQSPNSEADKIKSQVDITFLKPHQGILEMNK